MTLHYLMKDKDGVYVAHCVEIPAIIVYGKDKDEIESKLQKAITSYFTAFPEQRHTIKREEMQQIKVSV